MSEDGGGVTIRADAPLAQMFGYSTDLRSITQVGGWMGADGCLWCFFSWFFVGHGSAIWFRWLGGWLLVPPLHPLVGPFIHPLINQSIYLFIHQPIQSRDGAQGKGEFTMEYKTHQPVTRDMQEQLIKKYKEQQAGAEGQ